MKTKYLLGLLVLTVFFLAIFPSFSQAATSVTVSSPAQTEKTVTLSWTGSDDWFFSEYKAFYATNVNGPWTSFFTTTDKSQTTASIGNLAPNSDYYFKIEDSASLVGTTPSNTLYVKTKPVPLLEIMSHTTTTASLKWLTYNTFSSQVPFKSYIIQMRVSGGSWSTLETATDASQNTYTVTGLSPGIYDFQVIDKVGNEGQFSTNSNVVTLTIEQTQTSNVSIIAGIPIELIAVAIAIVVIIVAVVLLESRRNSTLD